MVTMVTIAFSVVCIWSVYLWYTTDTGYMECLATSILYIHICIHSYALVIHQYDFSALKTKYMKCICSTDFSGGGKPVVML